MSKVSTFVLMDDGQWYKNPVLGVGQDWYICFDDEEPPELVIDRKLWNSGLQFQQIKDLLNLDAFIHSKRPWVGAHRCFTHNSNNMELKPAVSYHIIINSPPPAKWIIEHDGKSDQRPSCECTFYPFDRKIEPPKSKTVRKLEMAMDYIKVGILAVNPVTKEDYLDVSCAHYVCHIYYRVNGNYFIVSKYPEGCKKAVLADIPNVEDLKAYLLQGVKPVISSERQFEIDQGKLKEKRRENRRMHADSDRVGRV